VKALTKGGGTGVASPAPASMPLPPPVAAAESPLQGFASHCRVAVVGAGMPRAGSTLQERLIHFALQDLHVNIPKCVHARQGACYWDWPRHVALGTNASKSRYAAESAWARKLANDSVVYYKSHEFAPGLVHHLCKEPPIIFTTHRCLRHVVRSVAAARWLEHASVHNVSELVVNYSKAWRHWRAAGSYDVSYEFMSAHPKTVYATISDSLAERLHVDPAVIEVAKAARESRPVAQLLHEANTRIPHHEISASERNRIDNLIDAVQLQLNDSATDPVRMGLSWC
jgi:hypothetical protein